MSQKTRQQLHAKIEAYITSNANNEITGALLNDLLQDFKDSEFNLLDDAGLLGLREYNPLTQYPAGLGCFYQGKILQANVDTTGIFNINDWKVIYDPDVLIMRSTGIGHHRFKLTVDDNGMLSQPGEDLGI